MSFARERVRSTRLLLAVALGAKAGAWGVAVAFGVHALAAVADLVAGLPLGARGAVRPLALGAALASIALVLWGARGVRSPERVALWVEERVPWLGYALVTSLDRRFAAAVGALEPIVAEAQWGGLLAASAARALARPLVLLVGAAAMLLALPAGAVSRVVSPRAGDAVERATLPGMGRRGSLSPLAVEVRPPAYTGWRSDTLDDPASITALVGSELEIRGRGEADRIAGAVGGRGLPVSGSNGRWSIRLTMPARAAAARLTQGDVERLLVLEPTLDRAPAVALRLPSRDTVLRVPSGRVPLLAEATDDIGLLRVAFEYIVSSGVGERFTFRAGTLGQRAARGETRFSFGAMLALDSLRLGEGDVVHVRAIARDGNVVSGPSMGSSDTRTIRVARAGEYDSLAVEAAPAAADTSALSQRMLIVLTERLEARRRELRRDTVVEESRRIAQDQHRLRRRVGELIFARLGEDAVGEHTHGGAQDRPLSPEVVLDAAREATGHSADEALDYGGGESPVVAINRPLLEAYNFMWEAGRALELGEPNRALPPMYRALAALQRARQAERYYLRGRTPAVIVDVARVRLQGKESGAPRAGEARGSGAAPGARRAARFTAAVAGLAVEPEAAIDSLILLRVDALADAPRLAAALAEAIAALRSGGDATPSLARARRALEGDPLVSDSLSRWERSW